MLIGANAEGKQLNKALLHRVFAYPEQYKDSFPDSLSIFTYHKCNIQIARRNVSLVSIPTMFYLFKDGRRNYFYEEYYKETMKGKKHTVEQRVAQSTIYHQHTALNTISTYLTPHIYDTSLFGDQILSPFHAPNSRFYRYRTSDQGDGTTMLSFKSRIDNTQLVKTGYAMVDNATGRIIRVSLEGDYDMVHFVFNASLGEQGYESLLPTESSIKAKIAFAGNIIYAQSLSMFNLCSPIPDTIRSSYSGALMDSLRPLPLSSNEYLLLQEYDSIRHPHKTTPGEAVAEPKEKKRNLWKYIFWDVIGSNALHKISTTFGENNKGRLRIGPIFNPLYFGYSHNKGVVYKFKSTLNYVFNENRTLSTALRAGYSFKEKQLYFDIPITFNFNLRRNGNITLEFANGNRITNSAILNEIKHMKADSIKWDQLNLDYFKDTHLSLSANYDVIEHKLGLKGGFILHKRSAVDKAGFKLAGKQATYHSLAPFLKITYRPFTDDVPLILSGDYEHGMKALSGEISYDRFEFDGQYLYSMPCMRSLRMRTGMGFYTSKGKDDYFLDYSNFRENYIPDAWDDNAGNFELLNSNWYNASSYYFRTNITYSSPLLLLSYVPIIGKITENERIYLSTLAVKSLHPYVETGYGFTNRFFSLGCFVGFSTTHFEGFGLKFGLELFNNW